MSLVTCPRCGTKVFRFPNGKLGAHTTPATGGTHMERNGWFGTLVPVDTKPYVHAQVCE